MEQLRIFSVTELTDTIKDILEGSFGTVTLQGEISNYRPSSTGHLYFTLKDSGAAISAVMFRNRTAALSFIPKDGMLVQASGKISVYPQRGTYQIIIETMSVSGEGQILQMLEERKRRLAAEGLFDSQRKKTLPLFPHTVGIVTSPTGAALRDILQILRRRNKAVSAVIFPCTVQGDGAGEGIAAMIRTANEYDMVDVLIIGRGGGSLEDILPFSDEKVVRAVAGSRIPVISAVGHEIDWALSDFAADIRAPTPSAAAELAAPLQEKLLSDIHSSADSLHISFMNRLDRTKARLAVFTPDNLELRFRNIEQPLLLRFDTAKEKLLGNMQERIRTLRQLTDNAARDIEAANPVAILERGYSVVRDIKTGRIIRSWKDTGQDMELEIRPSNGIIHANVVNSYNNEEQI